MPHTQNSEQALERYQITIGKDSQIKSDLNDWSDDPRYIGSCALFASAF